MKRVSSICSTIILILLVIAVSALAVPKLFGIEIRAVISGSMVPSYNIGDMVYAVPADFEDIKVKDTITYVLDESLTVVTHRVEEIDTENRQFYTKGDANNTRDGSPVRYENVLGVVRFSVPYAGRVIALLDNSTYKILAITGITVLVILSLIIKINARTDDDGDDNKAVHEEIAAVSGSGIEQKLRLLEQELEKSQIELAEKDRLLQKYQGLYVGEEEDVSLFDRIKGFFKRDDGLFPRMALLIVVLCVTASVTFALLARITSTRVNNFTIGRVPIEVEEPGIDKDHVDWGEDTKPVQITSDETSVDALIRVMILPVLKDRETDVHLGGSFDKLSAPIGTELVLGDFTFHFHETWEDNWVFNADDGYFYYRMVLEAGGTSARLLEGVTLTDEDLAEKYKDISIEVQVFSDSLQTKGGAPDDWNASVDEHWAVTYTFE